MNFGEHLRRERLNRKLSLSDVGKLLGCSAANVTRLETGGNLREKTLRKYAAALDLDVSLVLSSKS